MIEENKSKFKEIFNTYIKRDGADKLLEWLEGTDFFTCPASTKFHSAYEGGLCQHSLNVFEKLKMLLTVELGENWEEQYSMESVAIVSLLHDVCKADTYKTEMRNVKVNNEWIQQPYYSVDDPLPYGHGEKSVYIINGFLRLTREEAMAINWHMGGFDLRAKAGSFSISNAFYLFKLCPLLHTADLLATYLDECK